MNELLAKLRGGVIVSCQASPGWPFFGTEYMQRMAVAAQQGGAVGVRACWPDNIAAIKSVTDLPVIGVNKIVAHAKPTAADVIITPTFEAAAAIIEAGCDVLGIDCTARGRTFEEVRALIERIRKTYPSLTIMADISTLEEGLAAAEMGVDIVSTTLSGYTNTSLGISVEEARQLTSYPEGQDPPPDFALIRELRMRTKVPINAEGRIWEVSQMLQAFSSGADMVTIGSAITAPNLITRRFVQALKD